MASKNKIMKMSEDNIIDKLNNLQIEIVNLKGMYKYSSKYTLN